MSVRKRASVTEPEAYIRKKRKLREVINGAAITVEEASIYEEDYQMRMLEANDIEGILKVRGRGMTETDCYRL